VNTSRINEIIVTNTSINYMAKREARGKAIAHLQQLDQVRGQHRQAAAEQGVRLALLALSARAAHAVAVLFQVQREVVVDHVLQAIDVQTTRGDVCGYQDVALAL
jgi:5-formyltetrahydrofolate cyclo-ligase